MRWITLTILTTLMSSSLFCATITAKPRVQAEAGEVAGEDLLESYKNVRNNRIRLEQELEEIREHYRRSSREIQSAGVWYDVPQRVRRDQDLRRLRRGNRRIDKLKKRVETARAREDRLGQGLRLREMELANPDQDLIAAVENYNLDRLAGLEKEGLDSDELDHEKRYFERRMKLRPLREAPRRALERLGRMKTPGRLDD